MFLGNGKTSPVQAIDHHAGQRSTTPECLPTSGGSRVRRNPGLRNRSSLKRGCRCIPFRNGRDITAPAINTNGTVAYWATVNGTSGIATSDGSSTPGFIGLDTFYGPHGGIFIMGFADCTINDSGLVVFMASIGPTSGGIFVGPDPVATKSSPRVIPLMERRWWPAFSQRANGREQLRSWPS